MLDDEEGSTISKNSATITMGSAALPNIVTLLCSEITMEALLDGYTISNEVVDKNGVKLEKTTNVPGIAMYLSDEYDPRALSEDVSGSVIATPDTEYSLTFSLVIRGSNADDVKVIADGLTDIANDRIRELHPTLLLKPLTLEREEATLVMQNPVSNAVLFAFVASLVVYLVFFLKVVLDDRIYTEENVKEAFDYPVLGQIPVIE